MSMGDFAAISPRVKKVFSFSLQHFSLQHLQTNNMDLTRMFTDCVTGQTPASPTTTQEEAFAVAQSRDLPDEHVIENVDEEGKHRLVPSPPLLQGVACLTTLLLSLVSQTQYPSQYPSHHTVLPTSRQSSSVANGRQRKPLCGIPPSPPTSLAGVFTRHATFWRPLVVSNESRRLWAV